MIADEILKKLKALENPENVAGMRRFGIVTKKAFGVPAPILKSLAREIKNQTENCHAPALELWTTGVHEARIVAYLIDDAKLVSEIQMDDWAKDFDNRAICDLTCGHLFCKTRFAYKKSFEWSRHNAEFIKRAGIVLMPQIAVHDKKAADEKIAEFLPVLENLADDERNPIKKAVSRAVRQIGKRNLVLNNLAVETAQKIKARNTKTARRLAADAVRELQDAKTLERLQMKNPRGKLTRISRIKNLC